MERWRSRSRITAAILGISEDLVPGAKALSAGEQNRPLLAARGNELEEQIGALPINRDIADLINNMATAECYGAGQLAPQLSNNFGNVGATGGPAGVGFSDLDLKNSLVLGTETGYFLPQLPNLGLEVSATHVKPNRKSQPSVVTGPVLGVFEFNQTSLRVVTVAFDVIARAQMKGFEPDAGGAGLVLCAALGCDRRQ